MADIDAHELLGRLCKARIVTKVTAEALNGVLDAGSYAAERLRLLDDAIEFVEARIKVESMQ